MKAIHVTISGLVQGVGFRAWAEREAVLRNLSGWVRNRRNGTVEAVFAGEAAVVEDMVQACWTGPYSAMVRAVDAQAWSEPVEDRFEVRGTA
ncbi:Acylphosphate phosphohydrolase [Devosia sp. H5989]|nr:Acylphosphate phosphohydrolase [Devosia sp. H5989]